MDDEVENGRSELAHHFLVSRALTRRGPYVGHIDEFALDRNNPLNSMLTQRVAFFLFFSIFFFIFVVYFLSDDETSGESLTFGRRDDDEQGRMLNWMPSEAKPK